MRRPLPLPTLLAAVLLLLGGVSCASESGGAWDTFAGAWEDGWNDSGEFFGESFLGSNDGPYSRPDGWAWQGADSGRTASRLFLDSGDRTSERVPRTNPRREESAARSFFHWLLDVD